LMHAGGKGLEIEFDLIDHVLDCRRSDGRSARVHLEPRSVASFYAATMDALGELGVRVRILPRPVEVVEAIPFADDERHHADEAFGEFLLPYAAVRTAEDPEAYLLSFFQSTYEAVAELAGWDRAALELAP